MGKKKKANKKKANKKKAQPKAPLTALGDALGVVGIARRARGELALLVVPDCEQIGRTQS